MVSPNPIRYTRVRCALKAKRSSLRNVAGGRRSSRLRFRLSLFLLAILVLARVHDDYSNEIGLQTSREGALVRFEFRLVGRGKCLLIPEAPRIESSFDSPLR